MAVTAGSRLGPYEVVSPLGAGGMGEVWRARDPRLGRDVAVKVLHAGVADSDSFVRFETEARAASALAHPNIVSIFDVGRTDEGPWFAMELVEGRSLRDLLSEPVPIRRTLSVASQIADALAAAHARGIVHRDLKPENVIVTKEGRAKLLDFGLAKTVAPQAGADDVTVAETPNLTTPGTVMGTVGYMSPEQATGRAADFRSDQFAFGAILYEMLSGRRAFRRATPPETLAAIIREEAEPLAPLAPKAPPAARWIAERCLAKDPDDRYASTRDLARDLALLAERLSEITTGSGPAPESAHAPVRRVAAAAAAGASLVALALGLLGGRFLFRAKPAVPPTLRTLTYSGRDEQPAVSPDGRTLAFVSDRDGTPRVWLKQLPDGAEAALTTGPDSAPSFSPDGSAILFARHGDGASSIWRIPTVGGEPRRITDGISAALSPDGGRLAFLRAAAVGDRVEFSLLVGNANGSDTKVLRSWKAFGVGEASWSPDGTRLAIPMAGGGSIGAPSKVLVLPVSGGEPVAMSPPEAFGTLTSVSWSAAHEIVYGQQVPYTSGDTVFVRQRVPDGKPLSFLRVPNGGTDFSLSAGGVVYATAAVRENLLEVSLDPKTRRPAATRWLSRGSGIDRQPSFSPDGTRLAYSTNRGSNLDVWELVLATGAIRRLTEEKTEDWDPSFTHDGKRLLWVSRRTGNFEIWMAEADGSNPRQVSHDGIDAETPSATPNGDVVFYASYQDEKAGVWKVKSDGTQATRVYAGACGGPKVSPDGRVVLFPVVTSVSERTLRAARTDDGTPVPFEIRLPLANPSDRVSWGRSRWRPDGRAVAWVGQDAKGRSGIYEQDYVPGKDTTATRRLLYGEEPDRDTESFTYAPDGAKLVIGIVERTQSILRAESPDLPRPGAK